MEGNNRSFEEGAITGEEKRRRRSGTRVRGPQRIAMFHFGTKCSVLCAGPAQMWPKNLKDVSLLALLCSSVDKLMEDLLNWRESIKMFFFFLPTYF